MLRDGLFVTFEHGGGAALGIVLQSGQACLRGALVAEGRIIHHLAEGFGKFSGGGVRVEEEAVVVIDDNFPHAWGVDGDDRGAGGHGFGEDESLCFRLGGEGEPIHGGIGISQTGSGVDT